MNKKDMEALNEAYQEIHSETFDSTGMPYRMAKMRTDAVRRQRERASAGPVVESGKKWEVYFIDRDPDLAEGWISIGDDEEMAWKNLRRFFISKGMATPSTNFWNTKIVPVTPERASKEPFTQFQG
jgi:hypothetical protein